MGCNCNPLKCQFGDCIFPQRYIVTFMSLLGITFAYSMRSCLNIAITKMVIAPNIESEANPTGKSCPSNPSEEKVEITGGTHDWTEKQQGIILSAFFPGYVITHLPGGILSDSFGGKHVFAGGILISAILSVLTPVAVQIGGWGLLAAIRFVIGLSQGVMFPAALTIIAKWAPPVERGVLGSVVITGAHLGSVTGNLLSSELIAAYGTWQSAFYMWGFVSIAWYVFYLLMCYSEPSQSPFITEKELTMLTDVLGGPSREGGAKIPWVAILTSLPVWSIIICAIGHDLIFYFVSVQMPKYMANVLKMDIKLNGLLSASPYFFLFIFSNGSAFVSDFVIRKEYLSLTVCRKVFCTIGTVIPAMFLVLASYMECERKTVVVMFIFSMLSMGPFYPSLRISPADISKNFAGIIMALVNGIGALSYIPVPYITAVLAPDGGTYNWTEKQQGIILSAFFPGYVITHLPGGIMSDWFGGKHVFSGGIFISSILTILTPAAVEIGSWGLLAIMRFIIGLSQGVMFPAALTMVAKWAPPVERGLLGSIVCTGAQLGSVTGNLLSSETIAHYETWQSAFYMWGFVSVIWYVFFLFMCYSEPSQSPFITENELTMLNDVLGGPSRVGGYSIPWIAIITSIPVWAIITSSTGHDLIFYFVTVQMPKYMANVLKLDIKMNGLLSASPYFFLFICSNTSGLVSDFIIRKEYLSLIAARRIFGTIGCVVPGFFLILASYMECDRKTVVVMFIFSMLTMGPFYPSVRISPADISKNFAGIIMALVNGIGALSYIPIPYITAVIAPDHTVEQWRIVFYLIGLIAVVTNFAYVFWGKAERLPFDMVE